MSLLSKAASAGCATLIIVGGHAWAAQRRLFSYDPADAATRAAAGALTFEFDQHLFSTHLVAIRATEGPATAEVKSAPERSLGPGGLDRAAGGHPAPRDLYRIEAKDQGAAMIDALCPGDDEGWIAIERLRADHDLEAIVLGARKGGPARLCRRLSFAFHGEWRAPPGPGVDPRTVLQPHFPY